MKSLSEMGPLYIRQYRRLKDPLAGPCDADAALEVSAALCNRAALEGLEEFRLDLSAADEEFAYVLSRASQVWRRRVGVCAAACEFADAAWWKAVQTKSAELRTLPAGRRQGAAELKLKG